MNKKTVLIVLVFFFLTCLGGGSFLLWNNKKNTCNTIPSGYDFLNGFEIGNNCSEKNFTLTGTIYNGRIEGNNYTFDLNIINKQSKESKYYENISVNANIISENAVSILDQNTGLININMFFKKSNSNPFSNEYSLSSVNLTNNTINEEETSQYIKGIYSSIVNSPLKKETAATPRATYIHENSLEYSTVPDNQELYYFWLLSYIEKHWENTYIQSLLTTKPDTKAIMKSEKQYILGSEDLKDKNAFLSNLAFSCSLYKEIEENIGKIDKDLKKYYCDESVLAKVIPETYTFFSTKHGSFVSKEVFYSTLGYEEPKEARKEYSRRNNTNLSLLAAYFDSDMKKTNELEKQAQSITENYYDVFKDVNNSIQNDCLLTYTYYLASKKSKDNYYNYVLDLMGNSFLRNLTNVQKSLDNDIYSSVLCYESYKDKNESLSKIFFSNIVKSLYLNYYDNDEKIGVWEKNNSYDSKTNVLLIKILLDRYE